MANADDGGEREIPDTAAPEPKETVLLGGRIVLRPRENGDFDELLLLDANGDCLAHFEMMSDSSLWVGVYPDPKQSERISVRISAKKSKLKVFAEED